jgi:hypothetical protein
MKLENTSQSRPMRLTDLPEIGAFGPAETLKRITGMIELGVVVNG